MNKKWCMGIFATAITLAAPVLPAKADPIYVRYKSAAQTITSTGWSNVSMDGGSSNFYITVNLTSTRRVVGRFTSESDCYGSGSGYCSARIVYQKAGSSTISEFLPVVGTDFAFDYKDSANTWQSHAINRSVVLQPGTYYFYVQGAVTSSNLTLRLDDAHFEVELYNP